MKGEKEAHTEEKRDSPGESIGKGDFYFHCLCRIGTSGLWSSGRPTPEGGARNGIKMKAYKKNKAEDNLYPPLVLNSCSAVS